MDPGERAGLVERLRSDQALGPLSLSLFHPVTGMPLTFIAPPPPDMADVIELLRAEKGRVS